MRCPKCGQKAKVITAKNRKPQTTYRQRECPNKHRFSTEESVVVDFKKQIVKRQKQHLTAPANLMFNQIVFRSYTETANEEV